MESEPICLAGGERRPAGYHGRNQSPRQSLQQGRYWKQEARCLVSGVRTKSLRSPSQLSRQNFDDIPGGLT